MGDVKIEGMPAHVSWSSMETWMSCGKKFQLQRLLKVEQRPSWAAVAGSAVHSATEDIDHAREASGFGDGDLSGYPADIATNDVKEGQGG